MVPADKMISFEAFTRKRGPKYDLFSYSFFGTRSIKNTYRQDLEQIRRHGMHIQMKSYLTCLAGFEKRVR